MKSTKSLLALGLSLLFLTGCTSASGDLADNSGFAVNSKDMAMTADSYEYTEYDSDYSTSEAEIIKTQAMIARTADISIDVKDLDEFDTNIKEKVESFEGYFERADIQDYDNEYSSYRYAYYTVKVPAKNLDNFLAIMDENAKITDKNISSEDITLDYVDNEAKLKNLEIEKENLLNLLENATEVSDIIQIQDRLSTVQSNLDSYNAQKRYLENRVSYSEVQVTAREERNLEHPIRAAFQVNFGEKMIKGMGTAVEVLVSLIVGIPTIAIITAFLIGFFWLLKKIVRKVFKTDHPKVKYIIVKESEENKEE